MSVPVPLPVYMTVDVGPALATLRGGPEPAPNWEPTFEALPLLRDAVRQLQDHLGVQVPLTWFVRADDLVERQFGSAIAIFERLMESIEGQWASRHELGWMPQLPATGVRPMDHGMLLATREMLAGAVPRIDSVRMGDLYHDNRAMGLLADLGLRFDCSAVPGRTKSDPGWHVDWRGTPTHAYWPACEDYRRPGEPHWNILEIPMTVMPMQASYDPAPLLRYINPCFRREHLWPGLASLLGAAEYLVCVLHPDELLPGMARGHPMVAYSPDEFQFNMEKLAMAAASHRRGLEFKVLREFDAAD